MACLQVLRLKNFIYMFILHTALCLYILYFKGSYYLHLLFLHVFTVLFIYIFIYGSVHIVGAVLKTCLGFTSISHSLDNLGLNNFVKNISKSIIFLPVQWWDCSSERFVQDRTVTGNRQGPDQAQTLAKFMLFYPRTVPI